MASIARVDLTADDVRRCVATSGGCIAWNGRLNHSVLDDVVNAIARPLALDCNRWSVASILSKKVTAGATHVLVDLPYGPAVKLKTRADAEALGALFMQVGAALGLVLRVLPTDGSRPIGNGIGPALELRDALAVLDNDPDASTALRDKALRFAGEIIAFAPAVADAVEGRRIAETILASGEARARFDRIIDAQGRRPTMQLPGPITRPVRARRGGRISAIDGWRIAGIARRAGAPLVGADVTEGDLLYSIHGSTAFEVDAACMMAETSAGVTI
jgi:thymidine phosphorylase